jgi:ubiquitin carboxyl-terminal hydrolase 48
MVKYQFGKNWNWCDEIKSNDEIKDQHLDIVYRIDANICQSGKCKTNCSLNPYCLNGLGEKKLTNLLQKDTDLTLERSEFFRNKEDYAGLVNLGATCYINTYLQVSIIFIIRMRKEVIFFKF